MSNRPFTTQRGLTAVLLSCPLIACALSACDDSSAPTSQVGGSDTGGLRAGAEAGGAQAGAEAGHSAGHSAGSSSSSGGEGGALIAGVSVSGGAEQGGALAGITAGAEGGETPDAGVEAGVQGGEAGGEPPTGGAQDDCGVSAPSDEVRVAISFPYSDVIGVDGEAVQVYRATSEGLTPWGERMTVGFRPAALRFSHGGLWLIALGERGGVVTIDLRGDEPTIAERLELPSGAFRSIMRHPTRAEFDLPDANSTEDGGVYTLELSCEGALSPSLEHFPLRLTYALQRSSERPEWAIVLGGQARFEPIDNIDLRLLNAGDVSWRQVVEHDLYSDAIDAKGVALSASGRWAGVVNGSPFSTEGGHAHIMSVTFDPPSLQVSQSFEGLTDARRALFTPLEDRLMVSLQEPGALQLIDNVNGVWSLGDRVSGIGLIDDFSLSGPPEWATEAEGRGQAGAVWVWAPMTSPNGGSWLSRVAVTPGVPALMLENISLGEGFSSIPNAIDVWSADSPK